MQQYQNYLLKYFLVLTFKSMSTYLLISPYIRFFKEKGPWTTLATWEAFSSNNKPQQSYKWPSRFVKSCNYLPLEKGMQFSWINLYSLPPRMLSALCMFGWNRPSTFWRRRFTNVVNWCILAISLLFPLCKVCCHSFEQIWIPFTQGCFGPSWNEIGTVVLEKIYKCCQCI